MKPIASVLLMLTTLSIMVLIPVIAEAQVRSAFKIRAEHVVSAMDRAKHYSSTGRRSEAMERVETMVADLEELATDRVEHSIASDLHAAYDELALEEGESNAFFGGGPLMRDDEKPLIERAQAKLACDCLNPKPAQPSKNSQAPAPGRDWEGPNDPASRPH